MARSYYRVRLGSGNRAAAECFREGFIGGDWTFPYDLKGWAPDAKRDFLVHFRPIRGAAAPGSSANSVGAVLGMLWLIAGAMQPGDLVLSPCGDDLFMIGEVAGEYFYAGGKPLPHRRPVRWLRDNIDRQSMSDSLWRSVKGQKTIVVIDHHRDELESLVMGAAAARGVTSRESDGEAEIDARASFEFEKQLEDFLVANWGCTTLGKQWDILEVDGELVGQQYQLASGPADVVAVSKDGKRLLVVELKRGRASDRVLGQVLRYMGDAEAELAAEGQSIHGLIIGAECDHRLRSALSQTPTVSFMRYEVQFSLREEDRPVRHGG